MVDGSEREQERKRVGHSLPFLSPITLQSRGKKVRVKVRVKGEGNDGKKVGFMVHSIS